jgi:formyltetrahydrofolate synthetase
MNKYRKIGDLFSLKHHFLSSITTIRQSSYVELIEQRIKSLPITSKYIDIGHSQFDWNYLLDINNKRSIEDNYLKRKGFHKLDRTFPVRVIF